MDIIKAVRWIGRIVAILGAAMGVMIGLAGSWGDAFYALMLAAGIWFWTDFLVASMARSRDQRAAARGVPPSGNE